MLMYCFSSVLVDCFLFEGILSSVEVSKMDFRLSFFIGFFTCLNKIVGFCSPSDEYLVYSILSISSLES